MGQIELPRGLLLDLDGTIADTLPLIFDAYRHAVAPWVTRPPSDTEVEATFGPAERECIARMVPSADLDQAVERFHPYYETHHSHGVTIVEGIVDVIHHARRLGWRIGVFTGKGRRSAKFTLTELGLWNLIERLVSSDDVGRPKQDPEGVFNVSEALGVPVHRILFAGDSPADVKAGRSAGCITAAVLWAAFKPDRLLEAGADFTCGRVEDLMSAIDVSNSESLPESRR